MVSSYQVVLAQSFPSFFGGQPVHLLSKGIRLLSQPPDGLTGTGPTHGVGVHGTGAGAGAGGALRRLRGELCQLVLLLGDSQRRRLRLRLESPGCRRRAPLRRLP